MQGVDRLKAETRELAAANLARSDEQVGSAWGVHARSCSPLSSRASCAAGCFGERLVQVPGLAHRITQLLSDQHPPVIQPC